MIKPFSIEHVDSVSLLHLDCLTGLLHDLGIHSLRAFYSGAAKCDQTVAYVYEENNQILGFVFGAADPGRLRSEIYKLELLQTLFGTMLGVIRNPKLLAAIVSSRASQGTNYDPWVAELIYLAVDNKRRSSGVGQKLVKAFEQSLKRSGISDYELSVDKENVAAIAFYERLEFREIGQYREFGNEHIRMKKVLGYRDDS